MGRDGGDGGRFLWRFCLTLVMERLSRKVKMMMRAKLYKRKASPILRLIFSL